MSLEQLITFAIAMAVYVVTPGPGIMAVVARALADGMMATLPHSMGMIVGNMIYLLLAIFGLAWVAQQMGDAFFIVKLFGGLYLVYLGIKLWRKKEEIGELQTQRSQNPVRTFFTGMMITASNPKAILFYLAVLPAVLDLNVMNLGTFLPVAVINVITLALIVGGYAFIAARVRQIFTNSTAMRRLNRGAGAIMISAGIGLTAS
jgi:threonine/homoserine/homoserine lactone efflux protein